MMKFFLTVTAACLVIIPGLYAQNTDTMRTIKIRLLNGKNGKPMKHQYMNTNVGPARTDATGTAILKVSSTVYLLSFDPGYQEDNQAFLDEYAVCTDSDSRFKIPVEKIIKNGFVGKNECSKKVNAPIEPGTYVFWGAPRSHFELPH